MMPNNLQNNDSINRTSLHPDTPINKADLGDLPEQLRSLEPFRTDEQPRRESPSKRLQLHMATSQAVIPQKSLLVQRDPVALAQSTYDMELTRRLRQLQ